MTMTNGVTLKAVYRELKSLQKDVDLVKSILVPEEKVSPARLRKYKTALAKMRRGDETPFEKVFQ